MVERFNSASSNNLMTERCLHAFYQSKAEKPQETDRFGCVISQIPKLPALVLLLGWKIVNEADNWLEVGRQMQVPQ